MIDSYRTTYLITFQSLGKVPHAKYYAFPSQAYNYLLIIPSHAFSRLIRKIRKREH